MIGLALDLGKWEVGVDWDLSASLTVVTGSPNVREKPMGSTRACTPVKTALPANTTLTTLKVGRRKFMIGIEEDCCVCLTELGLYRDQVHAKAE